VKSSHKYIFFNLGARTDSKKGHDPKRAVRKDKNVNLTTDNGVRPFRIISSDVVLRQPRISLAAAV